MIDTSSKVELCKATFDDVKPIWENHLWPNRRSPIKPMSSMTHDGEIDMSIYDRFRPTFVAIKMGDKIVGVNSGHRTNRDYYRSRGLYVLPDYRRVGLASQLLHAINDQAIKENCRYVWTCPRLSAVRAYKKVGFTRVSDWTYDMEFGPNCFAVKAL